MKCNTYNKFFMNLANPLKLDIIASLRSGDKSVSEIASDLGVEQSKISHALSNLKYCNIVNSKQFGKQRIYSLNKETIVPMLKLIDKHKCKYCPGRKL